MKRVVANILLPILSVMLLAACAAGDSRPIYLDSGEVEPIRIPARLDAPTVRGTYRVGGYSLPQMAGQNEDRPPRVLSSAEAEASRSHIRFGERGLYLEVEDPLDDVWQQLGSVLNRDGMEIQQADADDRQYAFRFEHDPIVIDRTGFARLAFWQGRERIDHGGNFLIELEPAGSSATRVILLDEQGQLIEMVRAEYLLSMLREHLG